MVLLDNKIYVLDACSQLASEPGYRVIPLGISCLTGESLTITSIINLISIFLMLTILFKTFDLKKKSSLIFAGLFSLNSYIAFPYFYAAAHSYVYTIMVCILALYAMKSLETINLKSIILLVLSALSLKLVRSEGILYFGMSFIAFTIHLYLQSESLKSLWIKNKKIFLNFIIILAFALMFNFIIQVYVAAGEEVSKNLSNTSYKMQFPKESFYAVSIWATLDYLKAFLMPHYMNFYGNYLDWMIIHKSKNFQYVLYGFFIFSSLMATYFILVRKRTFLTYMIIALSIFLIPGFLISSFLRNQWFYPSRSLLGCILCLPFILTGFSLLKNKRFLKLIFYVFFGLYSVTFISHNIFHFKNEQTMYEYENKLLGLKNPTTNKTYAQYLLKKKDFLKATKVLRESGRDFPKEGIYLSANHFFLWAENLYWSAAGSHFFKSPLTEEKVLKELYEQPNFFAAIACLQDIRVPLENCRNPKLLRHLCNPIYKKKFGYTYYKKPRIKAEKICSQNQ